MIIYGVAILAGCLIAGTILGDLLGELLGIDSNVGGVGFAMILLMTLTDRLRKSSHWSSLNAEGVLFWSAMYIPIVVAMAATQNVVVAAGAGPVALLAGIGATVVCAALVPVLSRIGGRDAPLPPINDEKGA